MKKNKGITLIALVITIVVLLILASISIGVLVGDNGIINQSKKAKEETEISEEKELLERATVQVAGNDKYGNIDEENLQKELDKEAGEGKTEVTDIGGEIEVIFKENNRYYIIDKDGNVGEAEKIIEDKNPGDITKDEEGKELDGSFEKPYEIWCIEDLVVFSNMVNGNGIKFENGNKVQITKSNSFSGKYVKLMRTLNFKSKLSYENSERTDFGDINGISEDDNILRTEMITGTGFEPIGNAGNKTFNGNFLGNECSINNIYIDTENVAGLFGYTTNAAINNLTIRGKIQSTKDKAGGIVGNASKTSIEKCINYATVTTTNDNPSYGNDGGVTYTNSYSGGITGYLSGTVNECINYGKIATSKAYAAGIVAFCCGTIKNSTNYGEIVSNGSVAAGIGGYEYAYSEMTIINCANYGNVKSAYIAGGIWGNQIAGKIYIYNSYNLGKVESEQIAGGIHGQSRTSTTITNCYNAGMITGKNNQGGIIGYHIDYGTALVITNSYFIDNVEKEIGNRDTNTSMKYSKGEQQIVVNGLNDYILNNQTTVSEWFNWKIEDNEIVFKET